MGTSLTAGLGLDPAQAYPAMLQRFADSAGMAVEMVNAGLSGETSAGALRRIDWLMRAPTDVLVLETGANDGLRGVKINSTRANIQSIVLRARALQPRIEVMLVQMEAPPNLGERYASGFRAIFPTVARDEHIVLLPFLLDGVAGRAELNQADGMHPNLAGERIVAANLWRALAPRLASRPSQR